MPMIVFLLGRPGSGKTTIGDAMIRQLSATSTFRRGIRLSDLPFIRNTVLRATPGDPRFEPAENGGFLIRDTAFYEEALRDLARQTVMQARANDLLVLEFARQSYGEAFRVLAENGVIHGLAVYLDVSLQTALKRNRMRAARRGTDDHYVAEREMIETFGQDDISQILKGNQWENVIRIENDVDLVPEVTKVSEIIEIIKQTLRWHGR
jgi:adenylate kinase family enzyme